MSSLITFARQVRSRSNEHRHAMELLSRARLAGQMVSVLRQELDSMVRVIYLLAQDIPRRTALIESSVAGKRWLKQNSRSPVTDKEMVELAQHLRGWTSSVYKFGCAFIHLSNLHDYNDRDPLALLPDQERIDIIEHCRAYHGGPSSNDASFDDLIPYFPRVLEKVARNLECYIEHLENNEVRTTGEV